ncbi:hypothetical protein MYX76_15115 [Desulfobacterota bacterium AH_259_B03_O07]|nr:hypothetical protein [Desulfobacterota bacterium AH_259_B03_O07]
MAVMRLAIFANDTKRSPQMASFIVSSKKMGVKCRVTSTSLILEGRKKILLEILEKLGHAPFGTEGKKFAITLDFGQSNKLIPMNGKLESQRVDKKSNKEQH